MSSTASTSNDNAATTPSMADSDSVAIATATASSASRQISLADLQAMKATSDTVKKFPKSDFSHHELLRLLSFMEGELQAREVVIAALNSENLKQYIYTSRGVVIGSHDPQAALFRDSLATAGNLVSRPGSASASQSEQTMRQLAFHRLESLQGVITEQRCAHSKLLNVLHDFEAKHKSLLQQLADEKQKHERDTAQGDDITYGLEVERTRLRVDLESERTQNKRLEKEAKKQQETQEAERARQKTIVLLLLAERKRIIMKYMEERKRSEDLAQILSEEKQRVDTISEGLEEESKKSLRMEAELETQQQQFDGERNQLAAALACGDQKIYEQEQELVQLRQELLRKQQQYDALVAAQQQRMQLPQKGLVGRTASSSSHDAVDDGAASTSTSALMSSVTKVVQPTATVSSVPVSGPTTGIARSISPGQTMRPSPSDSGVTMFNAVKVAPRKLSSVAAPPPGIGAGATASAIASAAGAVAGASVPAGGAHHSQPVAALQQPQHAGKLMMMNTHHHQQQQYQSNISTIKKTPAALPGLGRGVPPPIPPNKPVVPPKREPSVTRMASVTQLLQPHPQSPVQPQLVSAAVAAAAAAAAAAATSAAAPASPMATGVAVATSGTTEDII